MCSDGTGSKFWFRNTCGKVKSDLYNRFELQYAIRHFFWDTLYDEVEVLLREMPFCWYNNAWRRNWPEREKNWKFRFILKVKVSILFIYQEYSGLWAPPGCSVETSSRYPVAWLEPSLWSTNLDVCKQVWVHSGGPTKVQTPFPDMVQWVLAPL